MLFEMLSLFVGKNYLYYLTEQCNKFFTFSERRQIFKDLLLLSEAFSRPVGVAKLSYRGGGKVSKMIETCRISHFPKHFSHHVILPDTSWMVICCFMQHFLHVFCCKIFPFFFLTNFFFTDLPLSTFKPAFCHVMPRVVFSLQ